MPADRNAVRAFLEGFAGDGLEVALEATTGWRFVVEELRLADRRGGAVGRAGEGGRVEGQEEAREDRLGRCSAFTGAVVDRGLPESWIPPVHILDLRAREQLTIALSVIDALDLKLTPFDLGTASVRPQAAGLPHADPGDLPGSGS